MPGKTLELYTTIKKLPINLLIDVAITSKINPINIPRVMAIIAVLGTLFLERWENLIGTSLSRCC